MSGCQGKLVAHAAGEDKAMRKYADTIVCWTFGLLIAGLLWYIRGAVWMMDAVLALLETITGETQDD